MTKKSRGKKKVRASAPRGLTRGELQRELGIGLTSVDRLIATGLRPVGLRGKARLYRLSEARRLSRRPTPADIAAASVLRSDHHTHAEDFRDRRRQLAETFIPEPAFWTAWRRVVARVARVTAPWPRLIANRIGALSTAEARFLPWADGPRLPGHVYPAPLMRPLLQTLADTLATDPSTHALEALFDTPPADRLPAPAKVDEARAQWRAARTAYRQARVSVRRGHLRRDDLVTAITRAFRLHHMKWWALRGQLVGVAGDRTAALAVTQRVRRDALQVLISLAANAEPTALEDSAAQAVAQEEGLTP